MKPTFRTLAYRVASAVGELLGLLPVTSTAMDSF